MLDAGLETQENLSARMNFNNRQSETCNSQVRRQMMTLSATVFVLGAGFNADASIEARTNARYPLSQNLAKACFGLDELPADCSIEDHFANAIRDHHSKPMRILSDLLIDADYHVGMRLRAYAGNDDNVYLTFLRRFRSATFLTFNYDSLVEMLLLSLNCWRPDDGYGMPVSVELPLYPPPLPDRSDSLVLHLHGSLMVYPQELTIVKKPSRSFPMLERRAEPAFLFDSDVLDAAFFPFERAFSSLSFMHTDERIVAPVLDKAPELRRVFVQNTYDRAAVALRESTHIVAIGYRFGSYDRASYEPLLRAKRSSMLTIVSPDAVEIADRLGSEHRNLTCTPVPATFADWARQGFRYE